MTSARVAVVGSFRSIPAAILVTFFFRSAFSSLWATLLGCIFFALVLAPVAAGVAVLVWRCSLRWPRKLVTIACIAMLAGAIAFYMEAIFLFLVHPGFFGDPFSASNLLPGVVVGAIIGYERPGYNSDPPNPSIRSFPSTPGA
jgi:hypothetical protein